MARSSSFLYYIIYICIGFLYPAYCSLLALQTKDRKDDSVWLIYWIVFATFNIVEVATDFVLFWFPLYPIIKLGFLAWCTAPIGKNGAFYVYKIFLEPFFQFYGGNINYVVNQVAQFMQNSVQYISAYTNVK